MESFRRDRCQGALLGLWLAPAAARTLNISLSQPVAADMVAAVALSFAQINHFTESPSTFHTRPWPQGLPYWLFSLPVLLRYHDSWQQRLQWVHRHLSNSLSGLSRSDSLTTAETKINSIATAQTLLLGDLLQIALSPGSSASNLGSTAQGQRWQFWQNHFTHLADRAHAYSLISGQTLFYQRLLTDLDQAFQAFQAFNPALAKTVAEVSPQTAADQVWVQALAIALDQLQSYRLTTPLPATWGYSALVAPLMAGALQGQAALPVLCQICSAQPPLAADQQILNRSTVMAAANRLVDQWAGILPIAKQPQLSN